MHRKTIEMLGNATGMASIAITTIAIKLVTLVKDDHDTL